MGICGLLSGKGVYVESGFPNVMFPLLLTKAFVNTWPKKSTVKPIGSATAEEPSSLRGNAAWSKQGVPQPPLATVRTAPASRVLAPTREASPNAAIAAGRDQSKAILGPLRRARPAQPVAPSSRSRPAESARLQSQGGYRMHPRCQDRQDTFSSPGSETRAEAPGQPRTALDCPGRTEPRMRKALVVLVAVLALAAGLPQEAGTARRGRPDRGAPESRRTEARAGTPDPDRPGRAGGAGARRDAALGRSGGPSGRGQHPVGDGSARARRGSRAGPGARRRRPGPAARGGDGPREHRAGRRGGRAGAREGAQRAPRPGSATDRRQGPRRHRPRGARGAARVDARAAARVVAGGRRGRPPHPRPRAGRADRRAEASPR